MMLIVEDLKIQFNKNLDRFTDDELYEFCLLNKELRIERDANQDIIIMSPVGGCSGYREKDLIFAIEYWVRTTGLGRSFSSSTGFIMPNGAMRSPDACWISDERWSKVTEAQKIKFPPVVPNFVVEVRSATDSLKGTKAKLEEWITNGVQLGWLVNTKKEQVHQYREDGTVEMISGFNQQISGDPVMPGFKFDLRILLNVP